MVDLKAEPPGGGRTTHATMRGTGHEPEQLAPEPIPGAYDPTTATHREAGAMGGRFNGADSRPENAEGLMDDAVIEERRREGGGE